MAVSAAVDTAIPVDNSEGERLAHNNAYGSDDIGRDASPPEIWIKSKQNQMYNENLFHNIILVLMNGSRTVRRKKKKSNRI